jgi:SPP1 gp7 family putative phage head morphogenesis protein
MVLADLGGQMHVRLVEVSRRAHLLADVRSLEDGADAFLDMPFDDAVAFWKAKGGSPELVEQVLAAYRRRAAVRSDETLDTIAQRAVDALTGTLEQGGTLDDFKKLMDGAASEYAASPLSDDYLDLVFRTNVLGAYGAGRWKQLSDPAVVAARPYRQWRTMEDERVRPEHAVADGMIWRADDPAFANVAAPAGFRCRCLVVSLDEDGFRAEGRSLSAGPPADFVITPGFGAAAFH